MVDKFRQGTKAFFNHDWTKVGAIILTLLGIALGFEHRMTLSEAAIKDMQGHKTDDNQRFAKVEENLTKASENLLKQSVLLDQIERRVSTLEKLEGLK